MPEDLMLEFKVTPDHPYYKEIQVLLSMSFIVEQTGMALIQAPYQSKQLDSAITRSLDDYIDSLSQLAIDVHKRNE